MNIYKVKLTSSSVFTIENYECLNITDKLGEIIYQQIPAQNFGYIKQDSIIYIDIDFDFSKTKLLDDLKNYIIKENRNIKLTNILN